MRGLSLNLFVVSLPLTVAVAVSGLVAPDSLTSWAKAFTSAAFQSLDWFFILAINGILLLGLWLVLSRHGSLRLGASDEKPEFSRVSWFSMLFAAGMGTGIMFWGVAEPLTHFRGGPGISPGTTAGATQAQVLTALHWGLHAWAIYAVSALVLAFFCFRKGCVYLPGQPIRTAFCGRWVRPVAVGSNLLAILAIVFGVAASITMGTFQIQTGLELIFGAPPDSVVVSVSILAVLVAAYMVSAASSLRQGIQWLSNINIAGAIVLGTVLLIGGPSVYILKSYLVGLGNYLWQLPALSVQVFAEDVGKDWFHGWTLTYFMWWIAWAPFVGVFVARISRGRTIREFVLGVMCVPTLFSLLWFAIFGGRGIYEEIYGQGGVALAVSESPTAGLFVLLGLYPHSEILSILAIVLVFIFLVTSVDSATFVLAMLTSDGSMDPSRGRKLVWGLALGTLGGALALTRSIEVVKAIAIVGAIPFTFVLLLQIAGFLRVLLAQKKAG